VLLVTALFYVPFIKRFIDEKDDSSVVYFSDNGWTFIVYSDCGEWSYFKKVIDPYGNEMDWEELHRPYEQHKRSEIVNNSPNSRQFNLYWGWLDTITEELPLDYLNPLRSAVQIQREARESSRKV